MDVGRSKTLKIIQIVNTDSELIVEKKVQSMQKLDTSSLTNNENKWINEKANTLWN